MTPRAKKNKPAVDPATEEQPKKAVDKRPHYKCHKTVRAHKIAGVTDNDDGSVTVIPAEQGFTMIRLLNFHAAHLLEPGAYLVYYEDGYISVSPGVPFEDGYTLIKG